MNRRLILSNPLKMVGLSMQARVRPFYSAKLRYRGSFLPNLYYSLRLRIAESGGKVQAESEREGG
jgi:hypothetical protein